MHTLAQGETLSVLAEKYKTTVGDIMRLNGMHADTKLVIGKQLKIPAPGETVERTGDNKPAPATIVKPAPPVAVNKKALTHIVLPKETMYAISKKYGITIDQLKQWNNIQDNGLVIGQEIAVSEKGISIAAEKKAQQSQAIQSLPDNTPPLVTKQDIKVDTVATNTIAQQKEEAPIVTPPVKKEKERPVTNAANDGSDNFFVNNFAENAKGKTPAGTSGNAMIFKTASGWTDKKYYVLMNEAPSGAIVKISAANGNVVYAKVLWSLDDMKENKGLSFRISEAAAAALQVNTDKFPLTVQYYP
ncbi:hypothetical protein BH11BAC6_BH11BAC6_14610 [soil metagenome]